MNPSACIRGYQNYNIRPFLKKKSPRLTRQNRFALIQLHKAINLVAKQTQRSLLPRKTEQRDAKPRETDMISNTKPLQPCPM